MNADLAGEPGPSRRRRAAIRSMMVAVIAVGLALGWWINLRRCILRVRSAQPRIASWVGRIQRDDPSLRGGPAGMSSKAHWLGARCSYRARFLTPAGREVAVSATLKSSVLGEDGEVIAESGGRSVSWPFADLERGRRLDLRAEFPEAFR